MSIFDVFRKVEGVSADEAKKILAEKSLDEVELIDVRQPQEFARGHLPGARLVPLPELANKSSLIDRSKKTILY
ncbi:MAG: rhodanese-like domain-containing protein [Nitrospiraceae bacterium]|jgi:rhodanese-related sulfurtransferase|nr:MAG: rhodanese-like domain-containing protein [Nitrospiraceae bacterium]UCH44731.1 MAG: rhodanese-like domain-containing protein [Nitrospiraceae bacterium]